MEQLSSTYWWLAIQQTIIITFLEIVVIRAAIGTLLTAVGIKTTVSTLGAAV